MKIKVNKLTLESVINNFQSFCKKDLHQITSHIYIETKDDLIILKATDYEIGITSNIKPIEIIQEGKTTFNAKKLSDILKRLKDEEVVLDLIDESTLTIKQGKVKFQIQPYEAEAYPNFPEFENLNEINIDSKYFLNSIKKVVPAIDPLTKKIELSGILLDVKDYKINFVATDTRRLAINTADIQSIDSLSIIIPKKAINEIVRLFHDDIKIYNDNVNLYIKSDNYVFFTKLINGKFPDYQRIIPKEYKNTFLIEKEKLIDNIKIINAISNKIKMTITKNSIDLEAITEDSSKGNTEIEYTSNIEDNIEFGFDSKHLLEFLANTEDKEFELCFNNPNTPLVFKNNNFLTISMPIILI